ncbi:hypothetical protein DBA29_03545 [Xenophilus aerolatus]|nr:hypothetical protein [Xenophilus aerolatus]
MSEKPGIEEFVAPTHVQVAAHRTQLTLADVVASRYDKLTGWLVAGMGAALTLMISNIDKSSAIISVQSIRNALKIFIVLLLVHVAQRLLALVIETAAAAQEKASKEDLSKLNGLAELFAYLDLLEKPAVRPFSWFVSKTLNQARKGRLMGARMVLLMQFVVFLALAQVLLAVGALIALVRGLV